MLDAAHGRCAGAAVVAADLNDVRVGLRHAARDGANARFRHQLHAHLRVGVDLVQVIDELREVLDGVDVVVGRGRDEGDTGLGAAEAGDVRGHLLAGKLAALAGLGALRYLDLQLVRVHQELGRHTKTAGRNLLDTRGAQVTVLHARQVWELCGRLAVRIRVSHGLPAHGVLPALATVGLATDAVHRNCDCLVCLAADGTQRHATSAETSHDGCRGLYLLHRDGRLAGGELEAVTQHLHGRLVKVLLVCIKCGRIAVATTQPDGLVQ
mmetsp:Transcript_18525/g.32987  ORF Transcript_18525/g.32987 Transcript_18525/m.32987 type:complete len:267 (+) Transcript_18525:846-1646(+)